MEYTLKRTVRGGVRIRVLPEGMVEVTAGKWIPKMVIETFVRKNEPWITRQKERLKLKTNLYPTFDWDNKMVSYLGKLYRIHIHSRSESSPHSGSESQRLIIRDQEIIVTPITGLETDARKMLIHWLKREGENYILQNLPLWANKMDLSFSRVSFRQQKSRWGSCAANGNLSFNWRLIHFKPEIIDYVLIHELAHIRHHDHSAIFWSLVSKFDPTYKTKRNFLHKQILTNIGS